jgi:hypothetical protein
MAGDQGSGAEALPTDEEPGEGTMGETGSKPRATMPEPQPDPGDEDAADRAALERENHERRET